MVRTQSHFALHAPWALTAFVPTTSVGQVAVYTPTPASRKKVQPLQPPRPPLEEATVPQTPRDTRPAAPPIHWGSWATPDSPGDGSFVAGATASPLPRSYDNQAKTVRKAVVGLSTFMEAVKSTHIHLTGYLTGDSSTSNGVSGVCTSPQTLTLL